MYFAQNDQRSFHRMELNLPIKIIKGEIEYAGICIDLSSTGMRISFSADLLKTDDTVHIQLNTGDERFPPLDAEAKLIRVTEIGPSNYTAAVEFLSLT
ncbi:MULTISPECIES: PilZ domain-containing protein [Psychromonas]|uniref:PilZ domain-containing protein n=1 Tax=Psychromonas TaxID=67572 RepID=UPI000413374B|nr:MULTISPECIES: PilZ domain-containing protein [Psychromonas]MBB1272401.1 PilZ domain-containing protein [Psychromonas sp. SR45-3]